MTVDGTNYECKPNAADKPPPRLLKLGLEVGEQQTWKLAHKRAPFTTLLIHKNNLYCCCAEGWTSYLLHSRRQQKRRATLATLESPARLVLTPSRIAEKLATIWLTGLQKTRGICRRRKPERGVGGYRRTSR